TMNGISEKDINLEIAHKLRKFLEAQDVLVIMTREDDEGLYPANAANKKVEDMKKRLNIIENAKADLAVSIHQNSFQQEKIHGAQVFYFTTGKESKKLAETIQKQMISSLDPNNTRVAKGNENYYLLKKTTIPIAIIECGFLSNNAEAKKLTEDYYQEKVAWSIHLAILQYLNQSSQ
ncbi:MAG: N-acetylmuramoyl-L-alanine amidase, partial [Lachnospiraceae bacterium]|nr:N-acetylmuramoyl-L-alanine amidase [Lachnospiraceae bacterium]